MAKGFLKRSMTYLGLTEEEDYDDDEVPASRAQVGSLFTAYDPGDEERLMPTQPVRGLTPAPREQPSHVLVTAPRTRPSHSTAMSPNVHSVTPTGFGDAKAIADGAMAGQPVIVNLQTASGELKRRIIDFCSGVVCGLDGGMERIASNVFLITPSDQELSADERRGA